jgi:hypothetical protein
VRISWMDANLIRVAPSAVIRASLPARIMALLAGRRIYQRHRKKKKARNASSLSNLCHLCRVASHCWLVGISSSKGWKTTHSFHSHGRDGPPSLLPHHVSWIDVVVVQARSPFTVSGVFMVWKVKSPRRLGNYELFLFTSRRMFT